jgi:hypothetical protein
MLSRYTDQINRERGRALVSGSRASTPALLSVFFNVYKYIQASASQVLVSSFPDIFNAGRSRRYHVHDSEDLRWRFSNTFAFTRVLIVMMAMLVVWMIMAILVV